VAVLEGSIVLIHTGASRTFLQDPVNHAHTTPRIGLEAARWLSSRNVIAVGADNHAVEVMPPEVEGLVMPVHQHMVVNQGIYLIENMKLATGARRAHPSG
jgi:kynurenine formamidase